MHATCHPVHACTAGRAVGGGHAETAAHRLLALLDGGRRGEWLQLLPGDGDGPFLGLLGGGGRRARVSEEWVREGGQSDVGEIWGDCMGGYGRRYGEIVWEIVWGGVWGDCDGDCDGDCAPVAMMLMTIGGGICNGGH